MVVDKDTKKYKTKRFDFMSFLKTSCLSSFLVNCHSGAAPKYFPSLRCEGLGALCGSIDVLVYYKPGGKAKNVGQVPFFELFPNVFPAHPGGWNPFNGGK